MGHRLVPPQFDGSEDDAIKIPRITEVNTTANPYTKELHRNNSNHLSYLRSLTSPFDAQ
jgi:hypothetical protein